MEPLGAFTSVSKRRGHFALIKETSKYSGPHLYTKTNQLRFVGNVKLRKVPSLYFFYIELQFKLPC